MGQRHQVDRLAQRCAQAVWAGILGRAGHRDRSLTALGLRPHGPGRLELRPFAGDERRPGPCVVLPAHHGHHRRPVCRRHVDCNRDDVIHLLRHRAAALSAGPGAQGGRYRWTVHHHGGARAACRRQANPGRGRRHGRVCGEPDPAPKQQRLQPRADARVVPVAGRAGLPDLDPAEAEPRPSTAAHAAGPEHPDLHHRRPDARPDGVRRDHGVVAPPPT